MIAVGRIEVWNPDAFPAFTASATLEGSKRAGTCDTSSRRARRSTILAPRLGVRPGASAIRAARARTEGRYGEYTEQRQRSEEIRSHRATEHYGARASVTP